MNLIDENDEIEKNEKKKKVFSMIVVSIIVLIVIAIVLGIYSVIRNKTTFKLKIDGKQVDVQTGLFLMQGKNDVLIENDHMYVSINKLANMLSIDYFNGEFKKQGSEEKNKCNIKIGNEYTSFLSDSSVIYKTVIRKNEDDGKDKNSNSQNSSEKNEAEPTSEYEYFDVQNGVVIRNGELYASDEAVRLGFNVMLEYDKKNRTVFINTLDNIEKQVAELISKKKSTDISVVTGNDIDYSNKRLLKYGMALIKNNSDSTYGIVDYQNFNGGNYVLSCRYSNIIFNEAAKSVIVTLADDSKQGVMSLNLNEKKATEIIKPEYQLIRSMNQDNELYLVKLSNRYGIIKLTGNTVTNVLQSAYQDIGIETQDVHANKTKDFILNEKYIPVKQDDKWGIVSLDGKELIHPQYAAIGCNIEKGSNGSGDGVIILPELINGVDGIVFKKVVTTTDENGKEKADTFYVIINVQTNTQVGDNASEIYSKSGDNKTTYYLKTVPGPNGATMSIDIYKLYGVKVKEATATPSATPTATTAVTKTPTATATATKAPTATATTTTQKNTANR